MILRQKSGKANRSISMYVIIIISAINHKKNKKYLKLKFFLLNFCCFFIICTMLIIRIAVQIIIETKSA
mgnify:CR=1 FL=1